MTRHALNFNKFNAGIKKSYKKCICKVARKAFVERLLIILWKNNAITFNVTRIHQVYESMYSIRKALQKDILFHLVDFSTH